MKAFVRARHQQLVIAAVYSATWGLMLLNGGLYWDDWCMVGLSWRGAVDWGAMNGQFWQPYYWLLLDRLPGGWYVGHAFTFILFLVSALLLNQLLRRIPQLSWDAQVLIPVIFAVFPVNSARLAHIDLQYTVSIAVFYFAWYLIAVDVEKPSLVRRVSAALLFALAMLTTKSLMLFFALVPLYIVWLRKDTLRDTRVQRQLAARYGPLMLLPILTWIIHITALSPSALYAGYNAITIESLRAGLSAAPASTWDSLLRPIVMALPFALPAAILTLLVRRDNETLARDIRQPLALMGVGFLAYALGVTPYLAVGKIPQSIGPEWWDSRHQILVPLGAALALYGLVMLVGQAFRLRRITVIIALAAFIAVFAVSDMRSQLEYQADWYKQVSLMKHMAQDPNIRNGNTFIVRDDALDLNVSTRRYLPYELGGMTYVVFGDATRFAVDEVLSPLGYADQLTYYSSYEQYHWTGWRPPPRRYLIHLLPGSKDITKTRPLLGLMWRELLAPQDFDRIVRNVVDVTTTPLPYSE